MFHQKRDFNMRLRNRDIEATEPLLKEEPIQSANGVLHYGSQDQDQYTAMDLPMRKPIFVRLESMF